MGRDKGLLLKDGVTWAGYMADKLTAFGIPVVFSVNPLQADKYALALPGARLVPDSGDAAGPLKGLLSVHERYPGYDLLLVGCDMLDLDGATLIQLTDEWEKGGHAFYGYREGGFFQPLCGIYTAAGLMGVHAISSLQQLLRQGKTKSLVILNNEAFRNYNTL
jgi:molybdopterin-guanine dinucleotide biosynthesis protein A